MARLIPVVLFLILAMAPVASAESQSRSELPFAGWFDAIWSALNRVFSWVPTIGSEPREHGANIDLKEVQSPPRTSGAYIVPSG